MKKLFKLLLILLVLVSGAAVALPFFISAETLKTQLAAQVKKATGRELKIEGEAKLSIFPNIALTAKNVTLGNPEGFDAPYLVKIGSLETGLALRPLLSGDVQVNGFTLDNADIYLEVQKNGAKNWEFPVKQKATETANTGAEKKTSPMKSLAIGTVTITNTTLHYQAAGAKPVQVKEIDLTLDGADGTGPLTLDANVLYQGERVVASLDMKQSKAFLAGEVSPLTLALALPGAKLDFTGTAQNQKGITAKGNLALDVASLPMVTAWATGKKPASGGVQKIGLKSPFSFTNNTFSFSELNATVDDISTAGKLAVTLGGKRPSVKGALNFGVLGLNAMQGKNAASSGEAAAAKSSDGWSTKPIDLSALKAIDAALKLDLKGLKTGKLEIGAAALDVKIDDGALDVGIDSMALYGGNAKGTVGARAAGIHSNLQLSGVQIEPLMIALSGKSRLEGTAAVDVNVRGSGNSQRAIVNTLAGIAKLRFTDGAIKGINLGKFLRDAKKGFLGETSSEKTDFAELSGSFQIANGIASNSDLAMKAPALRLAGKGTVNLPSKSLQYRLVPSIVQSAQGQGGKDKTGLEIPLLIEGQWANPSITPDVSGMVSDALKDPSKREENFKGLKENYKNLNSPKDLMKNLF